MPRKTEAARPARPASPPDPVDDHPDQAEGESTKDTQGKAEGKVRIGVPFESESAREAAKKRWADSRQTHDTASAGLKAAAQSQYEIATGPKSIPAAARTAAARAYADLIVAAEAAAEREGLRQGSIDWDAMPPSRMSLLRLVLDAEEEDVARWLHVVQEERNARAARTEREA